MTKVPTVTHLPDLWRAVYSSLIGKDWRTLEELYDQVARAVPLDEEDQEPQAPNSSVPKWKRNVRNVLQYRKGTGEVEWDGDTRYRLPSVSNE